MSIESIKHGIQPNRPGWWALKHKDGWWVGTKEGVTCYRDFRMVRMALAIVIAREGKQTAADRVYNVEVYPGEPVVDAGEHTPKLSGEEAIRNIEENSKPNYKDKL